MIRKFVNARSPLRILEQGIHGGLGAGNLGLVLAGHGVGKTPFLVGVALDHLLRGDAVLHVALGQTVGHTRAHYDTVWDELVQSTHLDDAATVRAEIDRKRSIRSYPSAGFGASKLREAAKIEAETRGKPSLVIVEDLDAATSPADLADLRALAAELAADVWVSVACPGEKVRDLPAPLAGSRDAFAVILALEPESGAVGLRALKDHDSANVEALRVWLDPRTLLLKRA
jgi:hypothetical protein